MAAKQANLEASLSVETDLLRDLDSNFIIDTKIAPQL